MENIVSLVKCVSYDNQKIQSSLFKSLALLKINNLIKKGQTVLVKPNMFQGFSPEKCGTTHPSILKALIYILQQMGVRVLVGDNPACLKSRSLERYREIAEITGVKK